jgi:hypothetical protein
VVPLWLWHGASQASDEEDGFQILRIIVNILNKQSQIADKRWSSSLGLGVGLTNPHCKTHFLSGSNFFSDLSRTETVRRSHNGTSMADPLPSNRSHVEGCSCSAELEGSCYSIKECHQRGGKPSNSCQDLAFVCCICKSLSGPSVPQRNCICVYMIITCFDWCLYILNSLIQSVITL